MRGRVHDVLQRRGRILTTALVTLVAIPTVAGAGHVSSGVASYTGCLRSNGALIKLAPGDAPSTACSGDQIQVHLSGGDITAVETPASGGLTGGTTNGSASLELGTGYKLPQGCASEQVPKSTGTNAWTCANDNAASGVTGLERVEATDPTPDAATQEAFAECPAGKSVVGGGYAFAFTGFADDIQINENLPAADLGAWGVVGTNYDFGNTSSAWALTAYALCADAT